MCLVYMFSRICFDYRRNSLTFQDSNEEELSANPDKRSQPEGFPQSAENSAKTEHDSAKAEQSEMADAAAAENNQEQEVGIIMIFIYLLCST